jgi:hypothetical protein
MERMIGEFNYWTDLMKRWGIEWNTGSEHKAHGKMINQCAKPYITAPDFDMVAFPSTKEIILAQTNAVQEYERIHHSKVSARREEPPQQVDSGGMTMMSNALQNIERAVELQLRLFIEAHCRPTGHRA